jgi:hypothetical protein
MAKKRDESAPRPALGDALQDRPGGPPREAGPRETAAPDDPSIQGPPQDTEQEDLVTLSDGDGPRSDRGTNPLPDVYWSAYPGKDGGQER